MNPGSQGHADSVAAIKQAALRLVSESSSKTSPHDLERRLARHFRISPKVVRAVIRNLISGGQLVYSYEFGHSFLEPSFLRPVQVASRIFLAPPEFDAPLDTAGVLIRISPGAAFGCGRHPSTRLALRAIEQALAADNWLQRHRAPSVLDIGTGTGVLVMAAIKLGIQRGVGIDTDPVARAEAAQNLRLNRLTEVVHVADGPLEKIAAGHRFTMVSANLRTPTLTRLAAQIRACLARDGRVVMSGIKSEELPDLQAVYSRQGLFSLWQAAEKGWAAVVLGSVDLPEK